jgi:hypothetical protein
VHPPAAAGHLVQVMLDHRRGLQRDLHLLMGGRHPQVRGPFQRRAAHACSLREVRHRAVRAVRPGQARCDPGAPGRLPGLRPPLPRPGFGGGGGVRPGRSSADGAMEELPLVRPRRRRSSATSSAKAARSDLSSPIAAACSAITASRAAHDVQPGAGGGSGPVTTGHYGRQPSTVKPQATPGFRVS